MKKKALFVLLVVIIAVLGYLYTRPPRPVMSIEKVYNVAEPGQTVLVNLYLETVPECGGWMINLTWDPYYVRLTTGGPNATRPADGGTPVDLYEGPFLRQKSTTMYIINSADNEKGEAIVGALFSGLGESVSGGGVILMANFTIVRVGTSAIEIKPPSPTLNQSLLMDGQKHAVDHEEVNGMISDKQPPPVWMGTGFQGTILLGEIAVLGIASVILYWRTHPRPPKSARRKAELEPLVEPEDQLDAE